MEYEVEFRSKARKDLARMSPDIARRILAKIADLRQGQSVDVKRLTQFVPEYRLRVGDYRVLFDMDGHRILIHRIKHRSDAYDS